ncbi:MAG: hypothetical protein AB1641_30500 [Thermodesulfobacteriota bacterium]
MKRIPLDQAQPGMILAQKIVRNDGVLLANKGAEITDSLLRVLARLNFETVQIEVQEAAESPDDKAARLLEEEAAIQARFVKVESDPILAELKKALLDRLHKED